MTDKKKKGMKIGAVIQARMSSKRYPGKVLYEIDGKPMLQYLLESLEQCDYIEQMIVATSDEVSDIPLVEFCNAYSVPYFRGSLSDVAERFKEVLDRVNFDCFIRVCGDRPLLDYRLIEKGIKLMRECSPDIVTNTFPQTYPKGQTVEILRTTVFLESFPKIMNSGHKEHITLYFYENYTLFDIVNFESGFDYGCINLSVDTEQDMEDFKRIIHKMSKPHWEYSYIDILKMKEKYCGNSFSRV